ncbi:MAG: dephospho-CoA kinase [Treponema sp.]|nr:dephospho-CoA kinase [Treponema sp.]
MIIGLTGPYCAGKNHISTLLESRGLPVLDVDKLGYKVLETEKESIFTRFGEDLKTQDGVLDRRLLGRRVFGQPGELAALEAIVHPPVNRLTDDWITAQKGHCVINAALLHRSSVFNKLEKIILVSAPLLTRILRARRRDNLSYSQIIKRFSSQKDFFTQYLSINAEIYRIENHNHGSRGSRRLEHRIDAFVKGIN